jgi:hypothetical protein
MGPVRRDLGAPEAQVTAAAGILAALLGAAGLTIWALIERARAERATAARDTAQAARAAAEAELAAERRGRAEERARLVSATDHLRSDLEACRATLRDLAPHVPADVAGRYLAGVLQAPDDGAADQPPVSAAPAADGAAGADHDR